MMDSFDDYYIDKLGELEEKIDHLTRMVWRLIPEDQKCGLCGKLSDGAFCPTGFSWIGYCKEHEDEIKGRFKNTKPLRYGA